LIHAGSTVCARTDWRCGDESKQQVDDRIATIWLAGVLAISAQDKYAVKVPNGLPFSDFKGYEDWQIVAVSQTDDCSRRWLRIPR